tara:strand:- start:415 stop:627 length:213 start_codon:yes stop_codon:yes gene_type:complete
MTAGPFGSNSGAKLLDKSILARDGFKTNRVTKARTLLLYEMLNVTPVLLNESRSDLHRHVLLLSVKFKGF